MQPSLPIPTDNIYKFACLFGLVLIVSAIFAFVTSYSSSLDRKVKHIEVMISLEAKEDRTKAENDLLAMHKRLIEVTKSNEDFTLVPIAAILVFGLSLSWYGANKWHQVIQKRDDAMVELQLRKLEAEVAKLEADAKKLQPVERLERASAEAANAQT
ncbi:hypothetical protein LJR260_001367 [Variovorax paradoxus]|uniref:hypothetical protein n=1 Tax=Variovorax paradoxus TaxID=34073 RepID=UPI003ECCC9E8